MLWPCIWEPYPVYVTGQGDQRGAYNIYMLHIDEEVEVLKEIGT